MSTESTSRASVESRLKQYPVVEDPEGHSWRFMEPVIAEEISDDGRSAPPPDTTGRGFRHRVRDRARILKRDTYAVYLAARHPSTPWYAKVLAGVVVAYALSPVDLIPDFIPILGYLDDLIIVPLGIAAVLRLMPAEVLDDCRAQAQVRMERPVSWIGAVFIAAVWLVAATWLLLVVRDLLT